MQRGKRTALAAALAGLLAAGMSGLALSQASPDEATAPSGHFLIIVPHGAMPGTPGASSGSDEDGAAATAPDAPDGNATDEDGAPSSGDEAVTPRPRILILVPVPEGAEQATPDENNDEDSNTAPGEDDASSQTGGRTLILVPHGNPHTLPPGILEA